MGHDLNMIIKMAEQRAKVYKRIIGTLMSLPDAEFLKSIGSDESRLFLTEYARLNQPSITKGCQLVLSFLNSMADQDKDELIELMAVDRTRLLRTPFAKAYPPPYEIHYSKGDAMASQLTLRQLYHSLGYLPATDTETVDYFAIELDFLRMLILEMTKSENEENATKISELLTTQKDFIENHPGSWIKKFVERAVPHGETDFYK
jgi:TorA maturation chaperone TorD